LVEKLEPRLLLRGNQVTAVVDDAAFLDDIADGTSDRVELDLDINVETKRPFWFRPKLYKYKIGEAGETKCQTGKDYSRWYSRWRDLNENLEAYPDGTDIKLCLLGRVWPGLRLHGTRILGRPAHYLGL
jgi:hypothetical protein